MELTPEPVKANETNRIKTRDKLDKNTQAQYTTSAAKTFSSIKYKN